MKVNNDNSGIWSGIKRLGSNTVYPAAFVVVGNYVRGCYQDTAAKLPTAKAVLDEWAQSAYASLTVENAKSLAGSAVDLTKSVTTSLSNLSSESVKTIATTLSNYDVEIQTAAAIGASATLIDAVLKRVPKINHYGAVRVATSISLATAAVYAGANFGLNRKVDPKLLLDIALKVGIVGAAWKVSTKVASFGFRAFGETSYYGCRAIAYCLAKASYGELPQGAKSAPAESDQDVHRGLSYVSSLYKDRDGQSIMGEGPRTNESSPGQPRKDNVAGGEGGETRAASKPGTPIRQAGVQAQPPQADVLEVYDDDPNLVEGTDGKFYYICSDQKKPPKGAVKIDDKFYKEVEDVSFEGGGSAHGTPVRPSPKQIKEVHYGVRQRQIAQQEREENK